MTFASRTLLALAAIAPMASALDVTDADFKLGLKLQLQVRAEKGWAEGTDNNRYDTTTGTLNAEPDDLDFSVRRARIGFVGTYKEVYRFAYVLRNDEQDKLGASPTTANPSGTSLNRVPQTHVAYLARDFKTDAGTHQFRAGLDYAFFNGANLNSSGWSPVVAARATEQSAMLAPRGVGVGYKYMAPQFTVGVDVQNNTGDGNNATDSGAAANGEGMFYGARAEFIVMDDAEKPHMKPQESFMGAPGKGVLVSLEAGINRDDNVGTNSTNTRAMGTEVFVHMDALTAVAELRLAKAETMGAVAELDRMIYLLQAAYAIPVGDVIVEPGLRYTRIDLNDDTEEASNYGASEYGASGYQWDLGATVYLNKNANKVAVGLQHWRGEGGGSPAANPGDATANIVRAQWSLAF